MITHTLCFRSIIKKLQRFEILRWTQMADFNVFQQGTADVGQN